MIDLFSPRPVGASLLAKTQALTQQRERLYTPHREQARLLQGPLSSPELAAMFDLFSPRPVGASLLAKTQALTQQRERLYTPHREQARLCRLRGGSWGGWLE
jgi:hypothetical protein